jgi:two-component system chemotaxis response regulator CheY
MSNTATASTRGQQALAGARILTLDDDANMRSIIRTILSQCGCRKILQASNGRDALKLFAEQPIDLVICDWMMEPMNGFDFLTELRKFEKGVKVPVIMLTANSETDDAIAAQGLSIAAWLVKPVAPPHLLERISSVLSLPTRLFSIAEDLDVDLTHLAKQYRMKLVNEVSDLKQLVDNLLQQDRTHLVQHWTSMVRLFHTIKGQAGTFGYELITKIGAIGLNMLRQAEGNVDVLIKYQGQLQKALTVLVGAMSLVLQNDIKGDAGNVGERLLGKIGEATVPLRQMIEAELKNAKKS